MSKKKKDEPGELAVYDSQNMLYNPNGTQLVLPDKPASRAPTYSSNELKQLKDNMSAGEKVKKFAGKTVSVTLKYFAAKLLASAAIAVGGYFVFKYLGVKLALLWSIIAAVCNMIPLFGQWVGIVIAVAGSWIETSNWKTGLFVLITLLVLQALDEFLITPLFVGKATSFKPILIIAIMMVASIFFGGWGVFFAVPIAAIIKIAYEIFILNKTD